MIHNVIAANCELKTLWFPLSLAPAFNFTRRCLVGAFRSFCHIIFCGFRSLKQCQILQFPLEVSRGQRGSGASPLIQKGGSPWGSDRLTCLAAMIDTLGLVWPLWLTSTSSLLAPVINSPLKCRLGNSDGLLLLYILLHFCWTPGSPYFFWLPKKPVFNCEGFQSDWVSQCSMTTEKRYVLFQRCASKGRTANN